MRILCDTNIILDVLLDREPFVAASTEVLKRCEIGIIEGFTTASCITDIFYEICHAEGFPHARAYSLAQSSGNDEEYQGIDGEISQELRNDIHALILCEGFSVTPR